MSGGKADIEIKFGHGEHGDGPGNAFDGAGEKGKIKDTISAKCGGGGHSDTKWLPTAKQLRGAEVVNAKI